MGYSQQAAVSISNPAAARPSMSSSHQSGSPDSRRLAPRPFGRLVDFQHEVHAGFAEALVERSTALSNFNFVGARCWSRLGCES